MFIIPILGIKPSFLLNVANFEGQTLSLAFFSD